MDNMDDLGVPPFMETPKWYQMMLNECKQHTNVAPGKKRVTSAMQSRLLFHWPQTVEHKRQWRPVKISEFNKDLTRYNCYHLSHLPRFQRFSCRSHSSCSFRSLHISLFENPSCLLSHQFFSLKLDSMDWFVGKSFAAKHLFSLWTLFLNVLFSMSLVSRL